MLRSRPFRPLPFVLFLVAQPTMAQEGDPGRDSARRTSAESAVHLIERAEIDRATQPGQSLQDLVTALSFAERSGDQALVLRTLRAKRDLEADAGDFDGALRTGIRVISLSGTTGDRRSMAADWQAMAHVHERNGNYGDAIDASKRVLFLTKTINDDRATGNAILELMDLLLEAGRDTEFKHQSEDALAYFTRAEDRVGSSRVLLRQGEALLGQGRAADALTILHRAQRELQNENTPEDRSRVLFDLARAHADVANWSEARAQLDEAFALQQGPLLDPAVYALCARVAESEGQLTEALRCERRRIFLRDSLLSARMAERVAGLQALYGLHSKERDMADLREQNKASTDRLISERWRTRLALGASLVLLASVAVLLLLWKKLHRAVRRVRLKNNVINKQADEIRTKNLELERQNLRLAETLMNEEEKDVILKEIHHRVKNDLQIVNALLKLQSTYADDPRLTELLHDCQGRIRSMAMVHEHIYKCGDLSRVNVKAHVMALAMSVVSNHGLAEKVKIETQVSYDRATLDDLTPLSLLLNELLTNSAKHAFVGRDSGRITIALRRMGETRCELLFSDDGVGLEQKRFFHTDSFGLELVRTLATQLNGTIHLLSGEGTTFQMTFAVSGDRLVRKAS